MRITRRVDHSNFQSSITSQGGQETQGAARERRLESEHAHHPVYTFKTRVAAFQLVSFAPHFRFVALRFPKGRAAKNLRETKRAPAPVVKARARMRG